MAATLESRIPFQLFRTLNWHKIEKKSVAEKKVLESGKNGNFFMVSQKYRSFWGTVFLVFHLGIPPKSTT